MTEQHIIIVTGWRDANRFKHGRIIIDALLPVYDTYKQNVLLREGECPYGGVDKFARDLAEVWGWEVDPCPADWDRFGNGAGPLRNRLMCEKGADELFAFPGPGSKGTINCMEIAYELGIPIRGPYWLT